MYDQKEQQFRPSENEGAAAFDNTRPRQGSSLSVLAEIHQRLDAVEKSQASIHEKIDMATKAGSLDPELLGHLAHIARKYFPHDMADTVSTEPARPKFDAFTGLPLQ